VLLFAGLSSAVLVFLPTPWSGIFAFACATAALSALVSWKSVITGYGCFALYASIWGTFHTLRALADNTTYANGISSLVLQVEQAVFLNNVPSAWLQSRFYDPGRFHWYDLFLTGIYASFLFFP
jgi:hypothetical protein